MSKGALLVVSTCLKAALLDSLAPAILSITKACGRELRRKVNGKAEAGSWFSFGFAGERVGKLSTVMSGSR